MRTRIRPVGFPLAAFWAMLACLPASLSAMGQEGNSDAVRRVAPRTYEIEHRVTLTRTNDGAPSELRVVIPFPEDGPGQRVLGRPRLRIDPLGATAIDVQQRNPYCEVVETAPFGSRVIDVRVADPPVADRYVFTLTYAVDRWNLRISEPELRRAPMPRRAPPDLQPYLQPETRVESADVAIQEALREIFPDGDARDVDTVYEAARRIYAYVLDHCEYVLNADQGRRRTLWGAADILANRRGECGDYAALFIALCRAAGIPARAQVGFWTAKPDGPHIWAEFHAPGIGWVPVDPSVGDRTRRSAYFGQVPDLNRRVVVTTGFDHHLGDRKIPFLQTFSYWFRWRGTALHMRADYRFTPREANPRTERR